MPSLRGGMACLRSLPMSLLDELDSLNPAQRAAATHRGSPLLILAGAGSGKTRVIVHRIAWLLEQGVPAWRIVGVTFTNKAAGEMRERVLRLLGERPDQGQSGGREAPWLGTFHSWCLRLLRYEVARTELRPGEVTEELQRELSTHEDSMLVLGTSSPEALPWDWLPYVLGGSPARPVLIVNSARADVPVEA